MSSFSTIGILGGMGPSATNYLCALITELTPAGSDQEHIPVITYNNARIPSRSGALLDNGPCPLPELIRSAKLLEEAGADFIVMPCHTAHYYLPEVQAAVRVPFIDMVEETVSYIQRTLESDPRVGILASTATVETGIYRQSLEKIGATLIAPTSDDQDLVMNAIFGQAGIKAGYRQEPTETLSAVATNLIAAGAIAILAACTEVSLVLDQMSVACAKIDPVHIVARVAVSYAMAGLCQPCDAPMVLAHTGWAGLLRR